MYKANYRGPTTLLITSRGPTLYGIFAYIWREFMGHVGRYAIQGTHRIDNRTHVCGFGSL